MSIKYAKQHNIPLVKKTTPRTFGSIKSGEISELNTKQNSFGSLTIHIKTNWYLTCLKNKTQFILEMEPQY